MCFCQIPLKKAINIIDNQSKIILLNMLKFVCKMNISEANI